jgi:acetolactate synthase I/II/III large subunit
VNVSEKLISDLSDLGYTDCFALTGGAASHLIDAFARQSKIKVHFFLHEQSCLMAADAYSRFFGRPAIVLVTNGPGVSNALTGLLGAFQDSVPIFCISGQVPTRFITPAGSGLRQFGVQESFTQQLVGHLVREFYRVESSCIDNLVSRLHSSMMRGRMAPVWLEVPLDFQAVEFISQGEASSGEVRPNEPLVRAEYLDQARRDLVSRLNEAERPLAVIGNGVQLSGATEYVLSFLKDLGIPVVATWTGTDIFDFDDPMFVGNFGILGERVANYAVQNSDCLVILGSRMSVPNIGYDTKSFSPNSFKIMVDIDEAELRKPSLDIDLAICCDLNEFFGFSPWPNAKKHRDSGWVADLMRKKESWRIEKEKMHDQTSGVDAYRVIEHLSLRIGDFDAIVTDMGSSFTVTMQALRRNGKTRVLTSSATSSMGFGLPGSLGIALADKNKRVLCISGDGGLQMNLQELHTMSVKTNNLKLLLLDSNGYLAISLMQENLFGGRHFGSTPETGVSSPDFVALLGDFGLRVFRASTKDDFDNVMTEFLDCEGSSALIVQLPRGQKMRPRLQTIRRSDGTLASPRLDQMWPELSALE